jgi:hypothetical protein
VASTSVFNVASAASVASASPGSGPGAAVIPSAKLDTHITKKKGGGGRLFFGRKNKDKGNQDKEKNKKASSSKSLFHLRPGNKQRNGSGKTELSDIAASKTATHKSNNYRTTSTKKGSSITSSRRGPAGGPPPSGSLYNTQNNKGEGDGRPMDMPMHMEGTLRCFASLYRTKILATEEELIHSGSSCYSTYTYKETDTQTDASEDDYDSDSDEESASDEDNNATSRKHNKARTTKVDSPSVTEIMDFLALALTHYKIPSPYVVLSMIYLDRAFDNDECPDDLVPQRNNWQDILIACLSLVSKMIVMNMNHNRQHDDSAEIAIIQQQLHLMTVANHYVLQHQFMVDALGAHNFRITADDYRDEYVAYLQIAQKTHNITHNKNGALEGGLDFVILRKSDPDKVEQRTRAFVRAMKPDFLAPRGGPRGGLNNGSSASSDRSSY